MPTRRRATEATDAVKATELPVQDTPSPILQQLRGMWELANLCQWIYLFGKAAKIDDSIDMEELETECLKPNSHILDDIALAILKLVSSHRGLTHAIFDSQAQKQYLALAPRQNPFGVEDEPKKFADFDVFTKIRVMQQLTQWTMIHPERLREKMEEQRDTEQTEWRIEPYGWDSKDRTYYVLDDNRVYRLTESPAIFQMFTTEKKSSRDGRQSNKRRRLNRGHEEDRADEAATNTTTNDDGLGGMKWECVAVTLAEVRHLVETFKKTRDKNEQVLRQQLQDHLLPILEKQEESRKRKEMQREKDLMNLAKMANAKRSSRIAGKAERQRQEELEKEEEERSRAAEAARKREEEAQLKSERERGLRLASREQRLKERESRRIQHEEELATLSEDSSNLAGGKARMSERQRQAEIARNRDALKQLEDEEDWVFDCVCGMYGHVDDGTHSVACEKCNVWQHSKCLGISEGDADRPDFHFVCSMCRSREQVDHERPKPTIKLKVNQSGESDPVRASTTMVHTAAPSLEVEPPRVSHSSPRKRQLSSPPLYYPREDIDRGTRSANGSGYRLHTASEQMSTKVDVVQHAVQRPGNEENATMEGVAVTPSPTLAKRDVEPLVSPALQNLHARQQVAGSPSSLQTLCTPKIQRNGVSARAGISPTKQSPRPMTPVTGLVGTTPTVIPPATTLSPTSREVILTPPVKSSPPRSPIKSSPPRYFMPTN